MQGAKHFKDIKYTQDVTYGEMFLQNEYEMSVYNLGKHGRCLQNTTPQCMEGSKPSGPCIGQGSLSLRQVGLRLPDAW